MIKRMVLTTIAAAFAAVLTPSVADAYGAAHASYTHVGPNGVYHASDTVARGPEGNVYAGGRTDAVRTGDDRAAYNGDYRYSPTYSTGSAHYAYVR